MALDGLVIRAMVHELQKCIGGRINKIHQPSEHDIVMQLRAQGGGHKLLLSANPTYPRVHFTVQQFLNPTEAPMFCMLLRKHLEGGVIERIEQVDMERIIRIHTRQRDELGDISLKTLVIELMGRHSNIILLDSNEGRILDGIHHVTPAISNYRIVMPGSAYTAPPEQHKLNVLDTGRTEFIDAWRAADAAEEAGEGVKEAAERADDEHTAADRSKTDRSSGGGEEGLAGPAMAAAGHAVPAAGGRDDRSRSDAGGDAASALAAKPSAPAVKPEQRLVGLLSGFSPLTAREAVHRSGVDLAPGRLTDMEIGRIYDGVSSIAGLLRRQEYTPEIVRQPDGGKWFFSVVPLTHLEGERERFESVSECLEAFYGDKAERDTVKQRTADLLRFLHNEKNKNVKKLDKLQETMDEARDADRFRIQGELLTASMHLITKGSKHIEVVDYYDEEQKTVTIPLDPLLTGSENAQRYFRKYTKAKNSVIAVQEQLKQTREEIAYLESLLQQLMNASMNDIEEIREELMEQGYIRDRNKKTRKKKKNDKPVLQCFTSSEGIAIYVGKNNTQNDYLTNRVAQAADTWLHTKDIPGSHVVIRSNQYGEATLEEAAQLAAYFSQAKESSQVPVDYTLVRHVRKPGGAKPGFVIYDHQKTLYITPDDHRIKQLKVVLK